MRRRLVEVHGLGVVRGGKLHDLIPRDQPRSELEYAPRAEVFPMALRHSDLGASG